MGCGLAFTNPQAEALTLATGTLRSSIEEITTALAGGGGKRVYVRSASLFDTLSVALDAPATAPIQLTLRDFQLIDGSVAVVAELLGLDVVSLDEAAA